jgi:hypothetical protein
MCIDKVILIHNTLIITGKLDALKDKFIPTYPIDKHKMLYKFAALTYSKSAIVYENQYNFLDFPLEECIRIHNIIKKICNSNTEALLQINSEIESLAQIATIKIKDFADKEIHLIEIIDHTSTIINFKSLFDKLDNPHDIDIL